MANDAQNVTAAADWRLAARSSDVADKPYATKVGGFAIVLFRRRDGSIAAIENRCPHYDLPLSTGEVVADDIECGHHGLRFDGSGRCTHMPATREPPRRFQVRSFETIENNGEIRVLI